MPNHRRFNASECLNDLRLDNIKGRIQTEESKGSMHVPSDQVRPDSNYNNSPRVSHQNGSKVIEFYSAVYMAGIALKNGVNTSEEQIKKFGLLEKLDRSYDFRSLPD